MERSTGSRGTMATEQTFVIAGASLACDKVAGTPRAEGFEGQVALAGEEAERVVDAWLSTKSDGTDLMPDEVDQVGEESFPCSDPPSWWSGRVRREPSPSEARGKEEGAKP